MASELLKLTIALVTSHLSKNKMTADNVPPFIQKVFETISKIEASAPSDAAHILPKKTPAPGPFDQVEAASFTDMASVSAPNYPDSKVDFRNRAPQRGEDVDFAGVFEDHIVCFEDGKHVTLLRAYIKNRFQLSPEQYRAKWDLPNNYPMTPPKYVATKRALAKEVGLGITRRSKRENRRAASTAADAAPPLPSLEKKPVPA